MMPRARLTMLKDTSEKTLLDLTDIDRDFWAEIEREKLMYFSGVWQINHLKRLDGQDLPDISPRRSV